MLIYLGIMGFLRIGNIRALSPATRTPISPSSSSSVDTKTKTFIKRPGVDKLILVVDGTWRQSDLDALIRAGWDEIFYPDEMDKLAKAII